MQLLLACAKLMNGSTSTKVPTTTTPLFADNAARHALELSRYTVDELADMLHCSRTIALENKRRYDNFFDKNEHLPAILAYNGQAYKHLRAAEFTADDFTYAQQHLFITSFLYGLLRPLDRIHPYRLEGKTELASTDRQQMFDYWKPRLTDVLIQAVQADDGILVHLATEEMQHLFDWKRIRSAVRLIQPQFLMQKDGKLRAVSMYAKGCRGAMARYIITHRIDNPTPLSAFIHDGFMLAEDMSSEDAPVFLHS